MAVNKSISATHLPEFAAALLSQRETLPRAQIIAEEAAAMVPNSAVVVYVVMDEGSPVWVPKATVGEIALGAREVEFGVGTLSAAAEGNSPVLFASAELSREDYAHLDVRRTVTSLAYVPLFASESVMGMIEMVSYEDPPTPQMLRSVGEIAGLAGPAMRASLDYENERNASLGSVTRVTQMYDLEKVFNSNLEMDELLTRIAGKFEEVMNVQAVNVWMVDGDAVKLVSRAGVDPTVEMDTLQRPGEGIAGDVSDNGEMALISDPEDERLRKRNGDIEDGAVFSLLATALMDRESLVGVVELINRRDGLPFDEDDEFQLVTSAKPPATLCTTPACCRPNARSKSWKRWSRSAKRSLPRSTWRVCCTPWSTGRRPSFRMTGPRSRWNNEASSRSRRSPGWRQSGWATRR